MALGSPGIMSAGVQREGSRPNKLAAPWRGAPDPHEGRPARASSPTNPSNTFGSIQEAYNGAMLPVGWAASA